MTIVGDLASTHHSDGQVERVGGSDLLVLGGRSTTFYVIDGNILEMFSFYFSLIAI